jgi:type II secretory pathway component PulJ
MKKMIVALALASGVAVIAYASLQNRGNTKQAIEKQDKKEMKKECKKKCLFS